MRILFCGSGWLPIVDLIRAGAPSDEVIVWDRERSLAETIDEVNPAVILPSNGIIDAAAIAAAKDLVLIQQPAAGYEGIDLAAAKARGIPVCNAPGANQVAVAEAALFLLLACARKFPAAKQAFARAEIGGPLGVELAGKTIGVIGMGRTGRALAERAAALGMRVEPLDSTASPALRARFFAACDAYSIHCPLTAATRGMLDDAAFAAMRPGAIVINVARGAIIDRGALERALDGGKLGGVGLDVFWAEPWDAEDALYKDPRVVTLPHVAGSTKEAFTRIAAIVCDNIRRVTRNEALTHRVA
ncbi:MAG TPA: NAD(P)-dependent oxidoreductase [Kofleriaceae bacterium]|nr:NAD(P)-dependent oxidoreductase [Kofleriaceae bacterium]